MRPFPLMLFAAGFGTRMGALTADRPKPLVPVAGRPLLDHALDIAAEAGVDRVVANLHYRGQQIVDHLAGRPDPITFSWEREIILETGGGLRQAAPLLGGSPVLTLNTDAVWTGANPLTELMAAWDGERMDALLLLLPAAKATGHKGSGDFLRDREGRLTRAAGAPGEVYLGAQILRTEGLADFPESAFSVNRLWDRLIAGGRLFGTLHAGGWCDVGQPESIPLAEALLHG